MQSVVLLQYLHVPSPMQLELPAISWIPSLDQPKTLTRVEVQRKGSQLKAHGHRTAGIREPKKEGGFVKKMQTTRYRKCLYVQEITPKFDIKEKEMERKQETDIEKRWKKRKKRQGKGRKVTNMHLQTFLDGESGYIHSGLKRRQEFF